MVNRHRPLPSYHQSQKPYYRVLVAQVWHTLDRNGYAIYIKEYKQ